MSRHRKFSRREEERHQRFLEEVFEYLVQPCTELSVPLTWEGEYLGARLGYEMHIYERLGEWIGGARDGAEVFRGYRANFNRLLEELGTEVRPAQLGLDCRAGNEGVTHHPRLVLSGRYKRRRLCLHWHVRPPDEEKPTLLVYEDGTVQLRENLEEEDDG